MNRKKSNFKIFLCYLFLRKKKLFFFRVFKKSEKILEKVDLRRKLGFFHRKNDNFLRKKQPKNRKNRKNSGKITFLKKKVSKLHFLDEK